MAKTYQNLVTEARELLQDTDATLQRYDDATLLNFLNRAMQEAGRIRPDAFYDLYSANSLNIPEVVASGAGAGQVNLSANFGIEMQFYTPLVSYVVAVAEITDDEYTVDGRAALLLQHFRNTLLGV